MPTTASQPQKRALLIAINEYPHLLQSQQLHGCLNDQEILREALLRLFDFPEANIALLQNRQATRAGILDAIDRLIEESGVDDTVVIAYSGHGSQVQDEHGDEPDGLDETIVPWDSGRDDAHPCIDISDDELHEKLLLLGQKTFNITLIFDCCHSGSIVRDAFGNSFRGIDQGIRRRETPRPARSAGRSRKGGSGFMPVSSRYVLLAGCRDRERSYELRTRSGGALRYYGAMTYHLVEALYTLSAGETYHDLYERYAPQVTSRFSRQHPQLEGSGHREIFGTRELTPMASTRVTAREGRRVTLAAGALQGLAPGSQWTVYAPEVRHADAQTPAAGTVRIMEVNATDARGEIVDENAPGILPGGRAVETVHAHSRERLAVYLDPQIPPEYARELARHLDRVPLLRRSDSREDAAAAVYLLPPRVPGHPLGAEMPVPQVHSLEQTSWVVTGPDGQLLMPMHPAGEDNVLTTICDNLEKIAKFRRALAITNSNPRSQLRGMVDFKVYARDNPPPPAGAGNGGSEGLPVFSHNEKIVVQITNHAPIPLYIYLIDFGQTFNITQGYPVPGAHERFLPGQTLTIGNSESDKVTVNLLEEFPFVQDPYDPEPSAGLETLKLFATVRESDFHHLLQEGVRSAGHIEEARGAGDALLQLFQSALGKLPADWQEYLLDNVWEDWTTVSRSFWVRREGRAG